MQVWHRERHIERLFILQCFSSFTEGHERPCQSKGTYAEDDQDAAVKQSSDEFNRTNPNSAPRKSSFDSLKTGTEGEFYLSLFIFR